MPWDYSIYPELTESQKHTFSVIGETLYMIQLAEWAIQTSLISAFSDNEISVESLYSENEKIRKKTMGQVLSLLRKRNELHPQFDEMLRAFLEKRNFFVHHIFNDPNYSLSTKNDCEIIEKFLNDLQDYAWNVQNVFLGCLTNWIEESGIDKFMPPEIQENKHLKQVRQKSFHVLFKPIESKKKGKG
jgi:hypothetical protein